MKDYKIDRLESKLVDIYVLLEILIEIQGVNVHAELNKRSLPLFGVD